MGRCAPRFTRTLIVSVPVEMHAPLSCMVFQHRPRRALHVAERVDSAVPSLGQEQMTALRRLSSASESHWAIIHHVPSALRSEVRDKEAAQFASEATRRKHASRRRSRSDPWHSRRIKRARQRNSSADSSRPRCSCRGVKQDSARIAFAGCKTVAATVALYTCRICSTATEKSTVFIFFSTLRYSWSFRYSPWLKDIFT